MSSRGHCGVRDPRHQVQHDPAQHPDQHQMKVPIDYGLSGWVWDASGNRSAALGLVNPFWIALTCCCARWGFLAPCRRHSFLTNIAVTLPPSSFYNFRWFHCGRVQDPGIHREPGGYIGLLVATIGSALVTGNAFSVR